MKKVTLIVLISFSISAIGKPSDSLKDNFDKKPAFKFEFFAIPAVFFNHATIGLSYQSASFSEHNISIGSWHDSFFFGESFNLNISYSLNKYFRNSKNYIPIWFKISNTRRNVSYEDGYHPHLLRYSIGTGFGRVFEMGLKWTLRTEFGIGIAINQTSTAGKVLSLNLNLQDYSFDQNYPEQNPPVIPAFRLRMTFGRILGADSSNTLP